MTRKLSAIDLFTGVPFDDTYKHVVDWNTQDELDNYLEGFESIGIKGSYQNINKPVRWDSNLASYNELTKFTYLRITNTDRNNSIKKYYGFITNLEYVNDGTIYIYYSIDMFNTYKWDISYNTAMIERGFCKELLDDYSDWTDEFREIRNNDEPIGGDGAEHLIASDQCLFTKIKDRDSYLTDGQIKFILITAQPQDVTSDPGSFLGSFSQYKYYLMAFDTVNQIMLDFYNKSGTKILDNSGKSVYEVYQALSEDKNFAGSSSLVVDSELIDYVGLDFEAVVENDVVTGVQFTSSFDYTKKSNYIIVNKSDSDAFKRQTGYFNVSSGTDSVFKKTYEILKNRYADTLKCNDFPYKLLANPFSKLYFSDGKGNNLTLDFMKFNHLKESSIKLFRYGGITENTKISYAVGSYNRATTTDQNLLVSYENALMIDDSAKDMPIILDNYTMYINSNKNQLANSRANAKMSLQLAKEGNQNTVDNMNRSINASNKSYAVQKNAESTNFYEGQALSVAKTGVSAIGQALTGNFGGALSTAVFGGAESAVAMDSYNRSLSAQNASRAIEQSAQKENARVNYAYNNKVATNNYEQFIKSQNAQLADVKNHNDVVAHQGTNNQWDQQNQNFALHGQVFFSQDSVMLNAGLYFLLFGYTIKKMAKISDYLKRKKVFNYVQTSNAQCNGAVAQPVISTFNAMFDSGVTFWRPDNLDKFAVRDYTYNEYV